MLYYDITEAVEKKAIFSFIMGGRGIGKTYSALRYTSIDNNITFLLLRTSEAELDKTVGKNINPFKKLNSDFKRNIEVAAGDVKTFIEKTEGDEVKIRGYAAALSTFSNFRGMDFSDVDVIIYDEFMREKQQKIKNIGFIFFNIYETINRNREIEGRDPVRVYFLSNAAMLDSPLLSDLGLVSELEMMIRKGQRRLSIPERGVYIHLPQVEVSEKKSKTALYKLAQGTDFYQFSIENEFVSASFTGVEKQNIQEYTPICSLDSMYIWRHKSQSNLYVTSVRGDCIHYTTKDTYVHFFRNYGSVLREIYARDGIMFESFTIKSLFLVAIKWN